MKKEKKDNNSQKRMLKLVMGVTLTGFIICVGVIVWYYMSLQSQQKKYEQLAQNVVTQQQEEETQSVATEEVKEEIYESPIDFAKLQAQENEHIYAWIQVEGTRIDYPVVQHPTEPTYYMDHNLDGSYGYPGCIFTEPFNNQGFIDPVTVVYGHYMKDGSMFAGLHEFKDATFFEENDTITIYMPEEKKEYQILAAYTTDDKRLTAWYDFWDDTVLQNFITDIQNKEESETDHVRDMEVTIEDEIIVLETCIDEDKTKRYVVVAVLQ